MNAGNLIWEVIPGNQSQESGSETGREEKTVQGMFLSWSVLWELGLILLGSPEEQYSTCLKTAHWKDSSGRHLCHSSHLPLVKDWPQQMLTLWHPSLLMCKCHLVPTSIPHHNVREGLEHKTEGMQTDKGEVLSDDILCEAGCYDSGQTKRWAKNTSDEAQKLSHTHAHISRLLFYSESAI